MIRRVFGIIWVVSCRVCCDLRCAAFAERASGLLSTESLATRLPASAVAPVPPNGSR